MTSEQVHGGGSLRARRLRVAPGAARAALAVTVYAVAAVYYSWPLVTDLNGTIYGAVGDLTGAISTLRELIQQGQVPFLPGTIHDFDAPSGLPVNWALNISSLPSYGLLWILGLAFGPMAAYGIYTLVGWVASAFAMYLLVRRITRSELAAFIAGYAFGFYPFATLNGQGHNDLIHGWPIVLLIWRMLELRAAPSRRQGLLAGAAAALAMAWTPYYLLIAGVVFATLFVVTLALSALRSRAALGSTSKALLWSLAAPAGYLLVVGLATVLDKGGQGVRVHTIQELVVYSARWYEYVIPPVTNPIVGATTDPWLARHLHGSNYSESRLYVGVSCLLLAGIAVAVTLRRARTPRVWARTDDAAVVVSVAAVALAAFVWSAPPQVGVFGHLVDTPSMLVFHVTSTFRAYSRFVVAVMAAVCLLAGIGIAEILRGRSRVVAGALAVVIGAVVITDTWGRIHPATNKIVAPEIYKQLRLSPAGAVAEYPLEPAGYGNYAALFYQQAHGHPILNGYQGGSPEEVQALAVQHLDDPATPGHLAWLGVRYVLLTTQPVDAPGANPGTPTRRGLRLIGQDAYAKLYRVTASPQPIVSVTPGDGFSPPESAGRETFSWMTASSATLDLSSTCSSCRVVLHFGTSSLRSPRRLVVSDSAGRRLARIVVRPVAIGAQRVSVPVTVRHTARLRFDVTPGPEPAGNGDARSLAIAVKNPHAGR